MLTLTIRGIFENTFLEQSTFVSYLVFIYLFCVKNPELMTLDTHFWMPYVHYRISAC